MSPLTRPDQIYIYAELLSNIRQVSVAVVLPSPSSSTTAAKAISNGLQLRVEHNGQSETVDLPWEVLPQAVLPIPSVASVEISWRLPLSPAAPAAPQFSPENQVVPWAASDIQEGSPVLCRGCEATFISSGVIGTWKDLPSDNWAEMMEFWHCHKPHDHPHNGSENGLADKAYGANNMITSQSSVGFVDLSSFMFDEVDCANLLFSTSTADRAAPESQAAMEDGFAGKVLHIFCKHCKTEVGLFNLRANSVNLSKWQVTCDAPTSTECRPTAMNCLAASLIANISRSGYAKSFLSPHETNAGLVATDSLYLWVLNPNVLYTSSCTPCRRTAMKVLYQDMRAIDGHKLTDSITSDVQDMNLPISTIDLAREKLDCSTSLLPGRERSFKEWKVGLIDRWVPTS